MRTNDREIPAEAKDEIAEGKLIQAIKITREKTGLSLKESKERIEAYLETDAVLKEKYLAHLQAKGLSQESVLRIAIIGFVAIIGYLIFFR